MNEINHNRFEAVIFDLDGVITQSARVHAQAWKEMFDPFLSDRDESPFTIQEDYYAYVDGKPRLEGIRSFFKSRGIEVNEEKLRELGERKNSLFLKHVKTEGIDAYQTSIALVHDLRRKGFKIAIVSSSKNCGPILESVGIKHLFEVQVDGIKSQELQLQGKPAPDIFLQAAKELGVNPERAVVVEDSLAGVRAGKEGEFGLVIGVNRGDQAVELKKNGADFVVSDLGEIEVS
ncbi:MAG: beta-phosphoglucomutase family hydrolase [Chlamydiales bacterium]|nr:beta-phosphoglucomutase family hydrolase [Chlamydiales bacterium]